MGRREDDVGHDYSRCNNEPSSGEAKEGAIGETQLKNKVGSWWRQYARRITERERFTSLLSFGGLGDQLNANKQPKCSFFFFSALLQGIRKRAARY